MCKNTKHKPSSTLFVHVTVPCNCNTVYFFRDLPITIVYKNQNNIFVKFWVKRQNSEWAGNNPPNTQTSPVLASELLGQFGHPNAHNETSHPSDHVGTLFFCIRFLTTVAKHQPPTHCDPLPTPTKCDPTPNPHIMWSNPKFPNMLPSKCSPTPSPQNTPYFL